MARDADALVLVFDPGDWPGRDLTARCRAKGRPVQVLGVRSRGEPPDPLRRDTRGLPD